jgi:hypothetical protein
MGVLHIEYTFWLIQLRCRQIEKGPVARACRLDRIVGV